MLEFGGEMWKEVRCSGCRALLCYEHIHIGRTMHKCKRCGEVTVIRYKTPISLLKKLAASGQLDGNPHNEIVLKEKPVE